MATVETKQWALTTAIRMVEKAGAGGYNKQALYTELKDLYTELINLSEEANRQ